MFNARERLNNFQNGVGTLMNENPGTTNALMGFVGASLAKGALTVREKELVAIGISVHTGCEDCIAVHTNKALEAGCTRQEILECSGVAIMLGGGPVLGASSSLLIAALNEFEKDFAGKKAANS
jgi:AhpD family alkylhydroperoxidase